MANVFTSSFIPSLLPATPVSKQSQPSDQQLTPPTHPWEDEKWRRRRCLVAGMACCMVIGAVGESKATNVTKDSPFVGVAADHRPRTATTRWSEKRRCPPWHLNSLETIVPENLPRPSGRRRWEAVVDKSNAPAVKVAAVERKSTGNCFSM